MRRSMQIAVLWKEKGELRTKKKMRSRLWKKEKRELRKGGGVEEEHAGLRKERGEREN